MANAPTFLRRYLFTVGKAIVSLTLLGLIVLKLDFAFFSSHWHKPNLTVVLACGGLLALQITVIAGTRLKLVLECLDVKPLLAHTSRVALGGFFFEQVAFGFVGGDAMRFWLLHRMEIPVRKAFEALFVDRCLGLVALFMLAVSGLPQLMPLLPTFDHRQKVVLTCATIFLLAGTALVFLLVISAKYRRHPVLAEIRDVLAASLRDAARGGRLSLVLALAVLVHLLNVLIMFLIGHDLGLPVSLREWFFIVPVALLFSMIPISAGGWGLREGILVFSLQGLGVRPEEAVVPSIVFGFSMLVVSLPGGIVWLSNRRVKVPATAVPDADATLGHSLEDTMTLDSLQTRGGHDR